MDLILSQMPIASGMCSRCAAKLCGVAGCLNSEFLNGISGD
jgi:hypothetical protein